MIAYQLTNNSKARHIVHDRRGKAVIVMPDKKSVDVELNEATAMRLKLQQDRGSSLHIATSDRDGQVILGKAMAMVPRKNPNSRRLPSPKDLLAEALAEKPLVIRDELADQPMVVDVTSTPTVDVTAPVVEEDKKPVPRRSRGGRR